jgi:tRNA(adenine34) deaminase
MRAALGAARQGAGEGEVPVGAVIVIGGEIVAMAHNAPIGRNDATAHAEVLVIREAGRRAGNYRLPGSTLYSTVEPCVMCCGAIINARIPEVVFGTPDPKGGGVESLYRLLGDSRMNHRPAVIGGVLADECAELMRAFFDARRT